MHPTERHKLPNVANPGNPPMVRLGAEDDPGARMVEADQLAMDLHGMFVETSNQRWQREIGWLETLSRLKKRVDSIDGNPFKKTSDDKEGSTAQIRIARTKCSQTSARMHDMVFQGGFRAFRMSPTPKPEIPRAVLKEAIMERVGRKFEEEAGTYAELSDDELTAGVLAGQVPDIALMQQQLNAGQIPERLQLPREEMDELVTEVAEKRAASMTQAIRDQMVETKFVRECRKAIRQGNEYGTSWGFGPYTEEVKVTDYVADKAGEYQPVEKITQRPFIEWRSMWDVYPYPCAIDDFAKCTGVFDRQVISKVQVRELRNIEGYDAEAIDEYLMDHPGGDAGYRYHWETSLHFGNENNNQSFQRRDMYELLKFVGYKDTREIYQYLDAEDQEKIDPEVEDSHRVVVAFLGHRIIRVTLEPWSKEVPLAMQYQFDEDETSVFGEGLMSLMEDPEKFLQAASQALINDLGKVGEAWAVDLDAILPEDHKNLSQLRDGTVVRYTGRHYDKERNPIQRIDIPTNAAVILQGLTVAQTWMDETSGMPRMAAGLSDGGTEDTVGVTSMRIAQANIVLKEPLSNFLECFLKPSVRALFEWNMMYGPDELKGDMQIVVEDVNSLLAKEIQHSILENIAAATLNPMDAPYINRGELNQERFDTVGLSSERFVKPEEVVAKEMEAQAEKMKQGQETPEVM